MGNAMVDEADFVECTFRKHFRKNERYVIYGLGKSTKVILERCPDYNFVGLMDRNRTGENEWGLPILSIDEVNELGVKKILIIATSANVPIIYRRISDKCYQHGINVYDINGNRIEKKKEYSLDPFYEMCREEVLKRNIDRADVISFDIFDTLLVRDVLYPTDLFEIVEYRSKDILPDEGYEFTKTRIESERFLYGKGQATIYEIYDEIQKRTGISDEIKKKLLEREIESEREYLHPRSKMKDIVEYALAEGKKVCCTSDMYLPDEILSELLGDFGFRGIDKIFVSCTENVSKNGGLFEIVKKWYKGNTVLHIGDNYDADIRCAHKSGISDTFQVSSVYKMTDDSAAHEILVYDSFLTDRIEIGYLSSTMFNDPFLFSASKGKCVIKDNYCLGYYFIEPILSAFVEWLIAKCRNDNIDILLLGSRDGYILEKILEARQMYGDSDISHKYFYASRFACTLAGMCDEEDVRYAFSLAFDGDPEEMLKKRFLLAEDEIRVKEDQEEKEDYLESYIPIILEKAKYYRGRYQNYLRTLDLKGKKIGFFDFVSSGTCQLWLENILPEASWNGYYFIRNLDKYKERLKIYSYFNPSYVYERQSKLFTNYIFMENIMTSYEPTLNGFSDEGTPKFEIESRSEGQLASVREVHRGILEAYKDRLKAGRGAPTKELADEILNLLNDPYSIMLADFFNDNHLEDEFCNRSFNLETMIGDKCE